MAVALDPEMEIIASLCDDEACREYYRQGVKPEHFSDPFCRKVFARAIDFYCTHGRFEHAPSRDVLVTEFPEWEHAVSECRGAAPSYLVERLKKQYVRDEAQGVLRQTVERLGRDDDVEDVISDTRDGLSKIIENTTPTVRVLEYGKDMEAYRKSLKEQREGIGAPYPFPEMQKWTGGIKPGELCVVVAPPAMGKAQPVDSNVLTPAGWKRLGDVRVGDVVKNRRGGDCTVSGVFPQGSLRAYEVEFSDGRKMRCSDEHLFTVRYKGHDGYRERDVTVREMLDAGERTGAGQSRWYVPLSEPMEFPETRHVIPPYVMGCLLGAGNLSGGLVTLRVVNSALEESIRNALPDGYSLRKRANGDLWSIVYHVRRLSNPFKDELIRFGLLCKRGRMQIPSEYLFDSVDNRRELLSGLLESKDARTDDPARPFSTTSKRLADGVLDLARSLGWKASETCCLRSSYGRRDSWKVPISRPAGDRLAISCITDMHRSADMVCIMLDDPDHLYVTDEWCLTHNTVMACKTALEAIRQGRNVYFASLELTVENIAQRIEYMQANVDSVNVPIRLYQQRDHDISLDYEITRAQDEVAALPGKLVIEQPSVDSRTPTDLIRSCKDKGCDFAIVDQLQFVTKPRRQSLQEEYGAALQEFKNEIMTPVDGVRVPLMLLHQMNRTGTKAQKEKSGVVGSMTDIAGSAWVEQIADVVWGLGRSREEELNGVMNIATLKARNITPVGWKLHWDTAYSYQFDVLTDRDGMPIRLDRW